MSSVPEPSGPVLQAGVLAATWRPQAKRLVAGTDNPDQGAGRGTNSEPIPLGHRQTIRKYFELIRPQGDEAEKAAPESGK